MTPFDDARRAVVIEEPRLPAPWINYLSNGELHAFVSQAGGGCLWWRSPLSFRLTRYRQQNLPLDSPGFYVYLREPRGTIWSPTLRPCPTAVDERRSEHRPGISRFLARRGELAVELTLFIAPDEHALVWDIGLRNAGAADRALDVFAYAEFGMFDWQQDTDWEYYVRHNLNVWFDPGAQAVVYLYHHHYHPKILEAPLAWLAATAPVKSFCGDRDVFIGNYGDEGRPSGIRQNDLGNAEIACGEPCAALHTPVRVPAGGAVRCAYFLGVTPAALPGWPAALERMRGTVAALRQPGRVDELRAGVERWWTEHLAAFHADLPDADCARMINVWNPVQCVHTARYSRSFSSQASGVRGMGFRDTCQDLLAIAYRKPDWAERTLLYLLSQQGPDGRTVHECFPGESRPPSPGLHIDDPLWLPMLAHAVLAETGDAALLERRVPWLGPDGRPTADGATVWEHLNAVVLFMESHLGEHGLPLILDGDWNDSIRKLASPARGESVFAAQQYVYVLRLLERMARGRTGTDAERYAALRAKQERAILACAWDGAWWRRGFDRHGEPIGSAACRYGQIWINAQSWAVIGGVGSRAQHERAMQSAFDLLNTDFGLKKLHPSFRSWPEEADPYSGYSPGCGENGAIFCHANTWAIVAEALLGNAERAWRYYRQLVPHLALQKAGLQRYQAEPYAYVSNIVGPENPKFGWANVTQVTGTAAWMDVAATQYLLGVRPELHGLRIAPCLPAAWTSVTVRRRFRGCRLEIAIRKPRGPAAGVRRMELDGEDLKVEDGALVPATALAGRSRARVAVEME